MNKLRDQYDKERSSLGRYLTSLRDFKEWSVEKWLTKPEFLPTSGELGRWTT